MSPPRPRPALKVPNLLRQLASQGEKNFPVAAYKFVMCVCECVTTEKENCCDHKCVFSKSNASRTMSQRMIEDKEDGKELRNRRDGREVDKPMDRSLP